jgi:hypothetical protein
MYTKKTCKAQESSQPLTLRVANQSGHIKLSFEFCNCHIKGNFGNKGSGLTPSNRNDTEIGIQLHLSGLAISQWRGDRRIEIIGTISWLISSQLEYGYKTHE